MSKQRKSQKQVKAVGLALSAFFLLSPAGAMAAPQQTPERPDAGKTLEGLKSSELNLPQKQETKVQVEEAYRPQLQSDSTEKFTVNGFRITGQNVFSEEELLSLIADGKGKESSLADLENLAKRITDYYHAQGYIMARAYVPAQRMEKGIVEISVIVGRYDNIIIRKHMDISDTKIGMQLGMIKSGQFIEKTALDKALWLLTDLAGVDAKATLAPGSKTGTSNLILDVNPKGKNISGSISIDNYGNVFTGRNEVSTLVNVLNPSNQGDMLSFYGVTTGNGLTSGSISYQLPAIAQGDRLEFSYSHMKYELGGIFAPLNYNGTADTVSIGYNHTLHRSRNVNLYSNVSYSYKKLQDIMSGTTDKSSNMLTFSLRGDSLDSWGGGGANSYSISYSQGRLSASDDSSNQAGTPGTFGKWNLTAARQQYINDRLSLVSFLNGQIATKNLDSSEKMSLGGPYGVRAYPKGEASGDNGYVWTSELHWTIPAKPEKSGALQLVGFYDLGSVRINKDRLTNDGSSNNRTLQGAGLGLVWNDPGKCTAKISYAWKIGSEAAKSDTDKRGRLWLQFTKQF